MRRLDLALAFFIPYWPVLGAFLWTVCPLDSLTWGCSQSTLSIRSMPQHGLPALAHEPGDSIGVGW